MSDVSNSESLIASLKARVEAAETKVDAFWKAHFAWFIVSAACLAAGVIIGMTL